MAVETSQMQFITDSQPVLQSNIVIVDDNPMVLHAHAAMIELVGHGLTAFECPQAALKYLQEHVDDVDLLITDYHMPGLNGLELIAKLREEGASFPVIVLTGYSYAIDAGMAKQYDVRVVAKPVPMSVLAEHICAAQRR